MAQPPSSLPSRQARPGGPTSKNNFELPLVTASDFHKINVHFCRFRLSAVPFVRNFERLSLPCKGKKSIICRWRSTLLRVQASRRRGGLTLMEQPTDTPGCRPKSIRRTSRRLPPLPSKVQAAPHIDQVPEDCRQHSLHSFRTPFIHFRHFCAGHVIDKTTSGHVTKVAPAARKIPF